MLQYLLNGIATGALYSVIALGIVLVYRTSRLLNFAHGDLAMVAVFLVWSFSRPLGFPGAVAVALLAATALGAAFSFGVLQQVKEATLLGQVVLTLGFSQVLSGAALVVWGADSKPFPFPLSSVVTYRLGGAVISQLTLGSLVIALVLMAGLYLLIQQTRVGLAMRAYSQDPEAARLLGLPTRRLLAFTWGVAALLGTAAGMLLAPVTFLHPYFMLTPFLKGFTAAVLGGLDSVPGAIVGGLLLGVMESLFAGYVSLRFVSTLSFALIVVMLLVRPEGLLGRVFQRRV
ncbi:MULTISPECIES: branched-chain amino acid ABC transporter permease [Limnochorda]|uniref:branched-chain amino acid ABC transporter permease n=1 Tax=Limnochorda TaxID=1676651 RepID=UPI00184CC6BD|nr:branched-chain amino acid ABC transporter permease [Limnochorda pilosa]MBO2485573.1 branched-chain amino acid ABC transporter permease [Bacillota bacterium]MBO2518628.1 branched-chain amino acid ABC transporter permease [Bacillota bacterium]NMA71200.1 branched-chain amino acid ABC transporter permease [Bacillota bacterium]